MTHHDQNEDGVRYVPLLSFAKLGTRRSARPDEHEVPANLAIVRIYFISIVWPSLCNTLHLASFSQGQIIPPLFNPFCHIVVPTSMVSRCT
jgi:hypothetical protein